ncbi:MAG TPA: tetratricopeptide repeat protein [Xanthobacteraceae bacterium]|jgi:tetratricopeptide (TPR) repeat protein|nr:tetratricopeptide repeat protein [Xanthobacteraceae bacterium]
MPDASDLVGEPYPGLRSFRRDETDIFFGREGTISEMVDRLAVHRFLAVTGISGSGKSSLVRTGLLNALDRGLLVEAGSDWRIADFRPGGQPLARLTAALVDLIDDEFSEAELGLIEAKLARGPLGLLEWLDEIEFPRDANLLLLVDQFEEIFRYRQGQSSDEIDAFVALLLATAKQTKRRVYVVITMRSDFLGDCARFSNLAETINDGQFLTPRLTREQCQEAIQGPAAVYGGSIEPLLVTRMLNDMAGNPDQLPLMQHVLMLMWQQARERDGAEPPRLTLADYQRLGGIGTAGAEADALAGATVKKPSLLYRLAGWLRIRRAGAPGAVAAAGGVSDLGSANGALSDHADKVLAELTSEQQRLAQILFRALTQGEGTAGRDVRRPTTLAKLAAIAEAPVGVVTSVIEAFRAPGRNFLTPSAPDPLRPDTVIDISHESLIRQWVKLRQWVREEYQSAEIYRDVERSAKQWRIGLHNLLSKVDLVVARNWRKTEHPNAAWAERYGDAFDLAMNFIRKSERHRLWRRGLAAAVVGLPIAVIVGAFWIVLYATTIILAALPYQNPADEFADFGVKPQATLQASMASNTPTSIPGGRIIDTLALKAALKSGVLEAQPFILIDAWSNTGHIAIPKAVQIAYAGRAGTFDDETQRRLGEELKSRTGNNPNMPLVFSCLGSGCWESYNASLRAINLGYSHVYWYRGGLNAWYGVRASVNLKDLNLTRIQADSQTVWGQAPDALRVIGRVIASAFSDSSGVMTLEALNKDAPFNRGAGFLRIGDYEHAVEQLTEAIKLEPKNAQIFDYRGRAYSLKKDYALATDDYNEAIKLDPTNGQIYEDRADNYYRMKDYDHAIEDYSKAIALGTKNDHIYNFRGNSYYSKSNYDKAIEDYSSAIELSPQNDVYYSNRGGAFKEKHVYDRAIADLGRAIELNPKSDTAYNERGELYSLQGKYDEAIKDFDEAIGLEPKKMQYYYNRGYAYYLKDDYDHAIQDYDRTIALGAQSALVHNRRGNAYYAKRDYDRAIEDYTAAIKLDAKYAVAYSNRGDAYRRKGDIERAIEDQTKAIELNPNYEDAYLGRAHAYEAREDYVHAIADFSNVIARNSKNAAAWNSRCYLRAIIGQLQDALADCNQSLKLRPNDPDILDSRAFTYLKLGQLTDALRDYDAVLKAQPKRPGSLFGRGIVKRRMGDTAGGDADIAAAKSLRPQIVEEFARYGIS